MSITSKNFNHNQIKIVSKQMRVMHEKIRKQTDKHFLPTSETTRDPFNSHSDRAMSQQLMKS